MVSGWPNSICIVHDPAHRYSGAEVLGEEDVDEPREGVHFGDAGIGVGIGPEGLERWRRIFGGVPGPMERLEQLTDPGGGRLGQTEIDLGAAGDETWIYELVGQDPAQQDVTVREVVEGVLAPRDSHRVEVAVFGQGEDADGAEALGGGSGRRVEVFLPNDVGLLRIKKPTGRRSRQERG